VIKFKISILSEKAATMMAALEYHDIFFKMERYPDPNHYIFIFEISPMELFKLGGTYFEYEKINIRTKNKK